MGFDAQIRLVRRRDEPRSRRFAALRSAVQRFSPSGFTATFARMERAVNVADPNAWTTQELTEAADLLAKSRARYLRKRSAWDHERRRIKHERWQLPAKRHLADFEDASWFDEISGDPNERARRWVELSDWVEIHGLTPGPFGSAPEQDVLAVLESLPAARHESSGGSMLAVHAPFAGHYSGPSNLLTLQGRVFNDPLSESAYNALSASQRTLADCWYSRSNDGYVRQRHVRRLVTSEAPWAVPYVVAALGDYVIEIVHDVHTGLADLGTPGSWHHDAYRTFAEHNHRFVDLIRRRATSYWNEYYRQSYARAGESSNSKPLYPAFAVLDELGGHFPYRYRLPSGD